VYNEGDDIDAFYMMLNGLAAFVLLRQNNSYYAKLEPNSSENKDDRVF